MTCNLHIFHDTNCVQCVNNRLAHQAQQAQGITQAQQSQLAGQTYQGQLAGQGNYQGQLANYQNYQGQLANYQNYQGQLANYQNNIALQNTQNTRIIPASY